MSGGSYDYAYVKVEEFAYSIREEGQCSAAPPELRRAFAEHCHLVARAMKAVEWNDSCDGDNEEELLIRQILSEESIADTTRRYLWEKVLEMRTVIAAAEKILGEEPPS